LDDHGVVDAGALDRAKAVLPVAPVEGAWTEHARTAGWFRESFTVQVRYLAAALLCYFVVVTVILISSDFLPYITDNNESFSTLLHARNILRFGLKSTAGLTDEANSNSPAAHPYVYTHEGNFPRLPALGLLVLGIDRIEWQITALAFLIGGLSTYLGFKVFSKMAGDLFAFLVVAVFSTDYLMYAQWQMNTFRVWHALFLFVILWCVQEINEENKLRIGAVLFLNSLCLSYFEIVFAFFAAVLSVIYAAILHRRCPARIVWIVEGVAIGGIAAMALLLGQLFWHLGAEKAWTDIRLTYLSRSFGDASSGLEAQWRKLHFFIQSHIVYWDSISNGLPTIRELRDALFHGVVKLYTPFLGAIAVIISLSLLVSSRTFCSAEGALRRSRAVRIVEEALCSFGLQDWRLILTTVVAIHLIWFVARTGLYHPERISLWAGIVRDQFSGMILQVVLAVSLLLGLLLRRGARHHLDGAADEGICGVTWYILSGAVAFLVTNAAFPGYIWNGYLARYAPIPVFVTDVWLALILYALLMLVLRTAPPAVEGLKSFRLGAGDRPAAIVRSGMKQPILLFAASVFLLLSIGLYWLKLQVAYYAHLPPTAIMFMRQLSGREFKHASFVSDNYSLPIAYFTGQWAYQDQSIPTSLPMAGWSGDGVSISGKYIWFADRDSNESYLHPNYYLCRTNPDFDVAMALSALTANGRLANCSKQQIVRGAQSGSGVPFRNTFIAGDPSPADMWAIVKLDSGIRFVPKD
jgi:hypothetical protein